MSIEKMDAGFKRIWKQQLICQLYPIAEAYRRWLVKMRDHQIKERTRENQLQDLFLGIQNRMKSSNSKVIIQHGANTTIPGIDP